MHPRVCLHQVAFMGETTPAFLAFCREAGVANVTLVTPKLFEALTTESAIDDARSALGGVRVACVNHVFAVHPDLAADTGEAARRLDRAIDAAASLRAPAIYLISGGRGSLDWEAAAERFAALIAPCREHARACGVSLMVENASPLNADIHLAHTLGDAITLAETADIGVCLELHACWFEGGLKAQIARAMPRIGLVQVSDYVLGDRVSPCRAVPGDGAIPLERLLGDVLELGYTGVFDLELVGPRIAAEGYRAASRRAAENLSELLTRLGA